MNELDEERPVTSEMRRKGQELAYASKEFELSIKTLRAQNAELVAALKATLYQYRLFVGPDDAIANATIKKAEIALADDKRRNRESS